MVNNICSFSGTKHKKLEKFIPQEKFRQIQSKDVISFGRALAEEKHGETGEISVLSKIIQTAKSRLGNNNVMGIIPSVCTPQQEDKNTGMGTLFSDYAQDFTIFLNKMMGINCVQDLPQGQFGDKGNVSPFSGSVDALGVHLIDPHKLCNSEYGSLISESQVKDAIIDTNTQNSTQKNWDINYRHVLGDPGYKQDMGKQRAVLESAFVSFRDKLKNNTLPTQLKSEYEAFLTKHGEWVEKNALYDVLSRKYGNTNINLWETNDKQKLDKDKDLYSGKYNADQIKDRIAEIKTESNEQFKNDLPESKIHNFEDEKEFSKFSQFIADKQQKEAKIKLNDNNMKLFGDCLIGYSSREYWANKSAFVENGSIGCIPIEDPKPISWGLYVLDFNKPEAIALQEKKFQLMAERYDGLRIDSAYQLCEPVIVKGDGTAERKWIGHKFYEMLEQVLKRVKGDKFKREDVYFEMLGGPAAPIDQTKNYWPHSNLTRHAKGDYGRVAVYTAHGKEGSQYGYNQNSLYMGIGTHDDASLIAQDAGREAWQKDMLADDLKMSRAQIFSDSSESRNARFAELLTVRNPFFTVFDLLGIDNKFNEGWGKRIPGNFKEFYYGQLTKGQGLNAPKALKVALHAKDPNQYNDNHPLMKALDKAARILKTDGPLSETQAKLDIESGKITEKLTQEDIQSI